MIGSTGTGTGKKRAHNTQVVIDDGRAKRHELNDSVPCKTEICHLLQERAAGKLVDALQAVAQMLAIRN